MADEQQTPDDGTVTTAAPTPATFRAVPTVALVAVGFLALCLSPIAFQGGPWFLLFLAPVAVGVWVVRGRTRVDEAGLHVRRVLGTRSVAWSDLTGLRLPEKGWVRAVPAEGGEVELRGIRIRDLGRVAEASGNRISAPTPAEAEAAAEHARELEAARMRVAKLRERAGAAEAVDAVDAADAADAAEAVDAAGTDIEGPESSGTTEDTGSGTAPGTAPATPDHGSEHDDTTGGSERREA